MSYEMSYESYEGLPDVESLAIVGVDASETMELNEQQTGEPKNIRAAWMVQEVLNRLDDPQYEYASITVIIFSADRNGVKVVPLLDEHNPYDAKTYTGNQDLTYWDGVAGDDAGV